MTTNAERGSDPSAAPQAQAEAPKRAGLVLVALILVAAVANLNLAVANVALPAIGKAFDASQTELDLVAVGYSLGLAASVLYLGALGDRYGRKMMLIVGTALAIPASLLAACAPSARRAVRRRGSSAGIAAGMAYPTTLALITALWSGTGRTKAIALWSGIGGAIASLGPLLSGRAARALLVGLGVPASPCRWRWSRSSWRGCSSRPRQRDDRAGRQPRRHPLGRARRRADPGDQLRAGPDKSTLGARARRRSRVAALVAFYMRQRRRDDPALRPRRRRAAHRSGSRRAPGSSSSAR